VPDQRLRRNPRWVCRIDKVHETGSAVSKVTIGDRHGIR
jgi:hypothetical protein